LQVLNIHVWFSLIVLTGAECEGKACVLSAEPTNNNSGRDGEKECVYMSARERICSITLSSTNSEFPSHISLICHAFPYPIQSWRPTRYDTIRLFIYITVVMIILFILFSCLLFRYFTIMFRYIFWLKIFSDLVYYCSLNTLVMKNCVITGTTTCN